LLFAVGCARLFEADFFNVAAPLIGSLPRLSFTFERPQPPTANCKLQTANRKPQTVTPQIYLIRHGETQWAKSGRHTGGSDIPLTDAGREQAGFLLPIFDEVKFARIFSSPLKRALETANIAGLGSRLEVDNDLVEWKYGDYEGLTTNQIRERVPDWTIWTHPCPNGETIEQVSQRADRIVAKLRSVEGNVAVFSHGHFLRVLVSRWIGLPSNYGRCFLLGTSTLSILGYENEEPVIKTWNGPLITAACAIPWKRPSGP
jgi:broad specificity phosphatase PhoE